MKVILASKSPRRREIFEQVGIRFDVMESNAEEITECIEPFDVVMDLSRIKAREVSQKAQDDTMIVGADTVVEMNGKILGKPKNEKEAYEMLSELSENTHNVYTGVTVIIRANNTMEEFSFYECTKVQVASMSEEEIRKYIASGEPFDKAGGYGIQGKFALYITKMVGDYYNVVGFPIAKFYQELLKHKIELD